MTGTTNPIKMQSLQKLGQQICQRMTFHSWCNGSFRRVGHSAAGSSARPSTKYQVSWYLVLLGEWGTEGQVALWDRPKFQRSPPSTGGAALAEGLCAKVAPENLRRQLRDLCHLFGLFDPLWNVIKYNSESLSNKGLCWSSSEGQSLMAAPLFHHIVASQIWK